MIKHFKENFFNKNNINKNKLFNPSINSTLKDELFDIYTKHKLLKKKIFDFFKSYNDFNHNYNNYKEMYNKFKSEICPPYILHDFDQVVCKTRPSKYILIILKRFKKNNSSPPTYNPGICNLNNLNNFDINNTKYKLRSFIVYEPTLKEYYTCCLEINGVPKKKYPWYKYKDTTVIKIANIKEEIKKAYILLFQLVDFEWK